MQLWSVFWNKMKTNCTTWSRTSSDMTEITTERSLMTNWLTSVLSSISGKWLFKDYIERSSLARDQKESWAKNSSVKHWTSPLNTSTWSLLSKSSTFSSQKSTWIKMDGSHMSSTSSSSNSTSDLLQSQLANPKKRCHLHPKFFQMRNSSC